MTFLLQGKGSVTVFSVMLILLFSRCVLADLFDEGFKAGQATCQDCNVRYQEGYAAGQTACPTCPTCQVCQTCPDCNIQFNIGKQ
jgi:hypothetical protein